MRDANEKVFVGMTMPTKYAYDEVADDHVENCALLDNVCIANAAAASYSYKTNIKLFAGDKKCRKEKKLKS